eukprot:jgi/Tetstr1/429605/TSEL_019503.t1
MSGSGSPTDPKMVDAGKAAAVEGVETFAIAQERIEMERRAADDVRMTQLIHELLSRFFGTPETHMPPAATGEEDTIPGGDESQAGGKDQGWAVVSSALQTAETAACS